MELENPNKLPAYSQKHKNALGAAEFQLLVEVHTDMKWVKRKLETIITEGFPRCAVHEEKIAQIERSQRRVRNGVAGVFIGACVAGITAVGNWLFNKFGG